MFLSVSILPQYSIGEGGEQLEMLDALQYAQGCQLSWEIYAQLPPPVQLSPH